MWNSLNFEKWRILFKTDEINMTPFNHNHLDYYSFILIYDNEVILNDSGGSSYDPKLKDTDARLPEYHNSVRIDGLGYKPDNTRYFTNKYIDCSFETIINKNDNCLQIKLMSTGFNRVDSDISFTRLISIYNSYVTILDQSFSNKVHPIEHYFHFPVDSHVKQHDKSMDIIIDNHIIRMTSNNTNSMILNKNKYLRYFSEQYSRRSLKNYVMTNSTISKGRPISYKIEVLDTCVE